MASANVTANLRLPTARLTLQVCFLHPIMCQSNHFCMAKAGNPSGRQFHFLLALELHVKNSMFSAPSTFSRVWHAIPQIHTNTSMRSTNHIPSQNAECREAHLIETPKGNHDARHDESANQKCSTWPMLTLC